MSKPREQVCWRHVDRWASGRLCARDCRAGRDDRTRSAKPPAPALNDGRARPHAGRRPDASCPENRVRAIGSATGFQVRNRGGDGFRTACPVRRPRDRLDDHPRGADRHASGRSSTASSASRPKARLAVLKRVPGLRARRATGCSGRARCGCSGPTWAQTVRFRLGKPLRGAAGATSSGSAIPTWAPAFAQPGPSADAWRASRAKGRVLGRDRPAPGDARSRSVGQRRDLRLPLPARRPATVVQGRPTTGPPAAARRARPRRAGPAASPGPSAARRRWRSGSGTRSAPGGRPPRGSPRRSSPPRGPPRAGSSGGARRPSAPPRGRRAAPPPSGRRR